MLVAYFFIYERKKIIQNFFCIYLKVIRLYLLLDFVFIYILQKKKIIESVSFCHAPKSGKFSYISKFHIVISCKLIVYIVMCFYQETN